MNYETFPTGVLLNTFKATRSGLVRNQDEVTPKLHDRHESVRNVEGELHVLLRSTQVPISVSQPGL